MNINRQYIPIFNSLFVNCDEATFDISIEKLMTIVEADLENDKEGRPRVSLVQVKPQAKNPRISALSAAKNYQTDKTFDQAQAPVIKKEKMLILATEKSAVDDDKMSF